MYDTPDDFGVALKPYQDVLYATFFDLLEDSNVDILMLSAGTNGQTYHVNAIYNNF